MIKHYIALFVYLALCVLLGILVTRITHKVCVFKICAKKAKLILSNMEQKTAPCKDFYEFTCGRYEGLHGDETESSIWEEIQEFQLQLLADFLGEPATKDDHRVLKVLKLAYKSCLNVENIEREGISPLLHNINAAGGFPLLQGKRWEEKRKETSNIEWSLDTAEYDLRYIGFTGGNIFDSYVWHSNTSDTCFVHLEPPTNLHFEGSHFDYYFTYVKTIISLLGNGSVDTAELNSTIEFQKVLASLNYKEENCSDIQRFSRYKVAEFSGKYTFFNLSKLLQSMSFNDKVPEDMEVSYVTPKYLSQLQDLLGKTNQRVIANHLMIENIKEVTPLLPKAFREAYGDLIISIKGPTLKSVESREIECVKCLLDKVSSALSALYLKQVFEEYSQPTYLLQFIALIKKQLYLLVKGLSWMDSETKQKALAKVVAMDYAVPVPMEEFNILTDDSLFRVYYEDLCFSEDTSDTLSSYLLLGRFKTDKNWELLEREFSVFDENINIFTSEVEYNYHKNLVTIPMGFLVYPTFDRRWPNYLNYGGLGTKVARELSRGIDYSGSNFMHGNDTDWWSVETEASYRLYPSCFINQYNDYLQKSNESQKISDPACVEDIIAGLAGLRVAYQAYLEYDSLRFFPERKLPKLHQYSPQQLFFVDFATFHCSSKTKLHHNNMTEAELSKFPGEYEVNGGLKNFKPFSEAFGCTGNDLMNPSGVCEIWKV